jgi:hypothetical protein
LPLRYPFIELHIITSLSLLSIQEYNLINSFNIILAISA